MNRNEFIRELSHRILFTREETAALVDGFLSLLEDEMLRGEEVTFRGFGSFGLKKAERRTYRMPDGRIIEKGAYAKPVFRAGKALLGRLGENDGEINEERKKRP